MRFSFYPAQRAFITAALVLTAFIACPQSSMAATTPLAATKKAGIVEKLNQQVDLSLVFTEQLGKAQPLSDTILEDRPTIIVPVYYECPNLCSLTLNGVLKLLNEIDLELGSDFKLLAVSINPRENHELASKKADNYYQKLNKPELGPKGWGFLTGEQGNITPLMKQLGFIYEEDGKDYAHTAAFMILTPAGNVSRYFYGVDYSAEDVKYALVDAAAGKIGSTLDRVFLYCFTFDPTKGKYTPMIWNIIRVICLGFLALLVLTLTLLRLREKRGSTHV